jgi:hypothetical protein
MKAIITKVTFLKEQDGKFGKEYNFQISYDGKSAYYSAKKNPQTHFVEGQECEFTETELTSKNTGNKYFTVKPVTAAYQGKSNYGKALAKEQSKYSGFACSYAKDLVVAGKIPHSDLLKHAKEMFDWMVEQDKIFAND